MKNAKVIAFILIILTIITTVFCTSCEKNCAHEWQPATCTTPITCSLCNEIEGSALGHTWDDATCTTPKTCIICNETAGNALGHKWDQATCTNPQKCTVCEDTEGEALGHTWNDATCMTPKTCSVCGESEGEIGSHIDAGNGKCKHCSQDILLLEIKENLSIKLLVPRIGEKNGWCQIEYMNNTNYTFSCDMIMVFVNGNAMYPRTESFTVKPGELFTNFHSRYILPNSSNAYDAKYRDTYLDNESTAHVEIEINGKTVYIRFGVNGITQIGYSKADIGVY